MKALASNSRDSLQHYFGVRTEFLKRHVWVIIRDLKFFFSDASTTVVYKEDFHWPFLNSRIRAYQKLGERSSGIALDRFLDVE